MKNALVTVVLLATLSGCAGSAAKTPAAAPTPQPSCSKLPDPVLPHSAGTLTEQQAGVYCLPMGDRVDVFLTAARGGRWQPVHASDGGTVVTPTNTGVMTAPLGVTPAMFVGTAVGVTRISSSTTSGKSWTVTLVVRRH
ncbi:hypothetical protein [Streptacidiphilus rugosus]|uniref:hypothetical protein n=1 Tax=Streptacidiphilus rugosus TaxID=405783 RepID=UPI00055A26BA|nr:hypothetical protein [Streptacidiphilus rugosus]